MFEFINKHCGRVQFAGQIREPGERFTLEEVPENLGEFIVYVPRAEKRAVPAKETEQGGSVPVGFDTSSYPEELTGKQALEIAAGYGLVEEFKGWRDAGEIEGAHRKGEAPNSPWVIPKSGLLARLSKHNTEA